jgi:hypothetical protein
VYKDIDGKATQPAILALVIEANIIKVNKKGKIKRQNNLHSSMSLSL